MSIHPYLQALAAYRGFHPEGWIRIYEIVPIWAAILLILFGAFLLPFGGGRPFRIVAAPIGAVIGFTFVPAAVGLFHVPLAPQVLAASGAMGMFVIGALYPPAMVFLAVALPAGLLGAGLAGVDDMVLGFVPGFLLAGAVGAMMHRWVSSVASAAVGGWILVLGLLTVLHRVPFVASAVHHPWIVIGLAAGLAIAGSVYQIAVRPSPEAEQHRKFEEARERTRLAEARALEERWAKYSERK